MPRWQADAEARLRKAALALYEERGFDATTVEEIAERAGLTRRTFFRYFADKREVLFGDGADVDESFADVIRAAPASAGALDAIGLGLTALAGSLERQAEETARRFRIVRASPQLWERQLIKFAALAESGARALRARGVGSQAATLAAESGITALRVASERWIRNPRTKSLRQLIAETLSELRTVVSDEGQPVARRRSGAS